MGGMGRWRVRGGRWRVVEGTAINGFLKRGTNIRHVGMQAGLCKNGHVVAKHNANSLSLFS
jgi:hypothetical protein